MSPNLRISGLKMRNESRNDARPRRLVAFSWPTLSLPPRGAAGFARVIGTWASISLCCL